MRLQLQKPSWNLLATAVLICMLAGCTAPSGAPQQSGFLNRDIKRLQSALELQEKSIAKLSEQIDELQEEQLRQAALLEQAQRSPHMREEPRQGYALPKATWSSETQNTGEGSPTEVYLQAFGDYASGRYKVAIHGFESFLQRFPNNSYASNAQFWLADSYFNQQQYATAIVEFQRVINDYQAATKSPDALYKVAIAQLQLGNPDEARDVIDLLQRRHPKSAAAQKAQELVIP
jgi:tol-pal system protein YbgF